MRWRAFQKNKASRSLTMCAPPSDKSSNGGKD